MVEVGKGGSFQAMRSGQVALAAEKRDVPSPEIPQGGRESQVRAARSNQMAIGKSGAAEADDGFVGVGTDPAVRVVRDDEKLGQVEQHREDKNIVDNNAEVDGEFLNGGRT